MAKKKITTKATKSKPATEPEEKFTSEEDEAYEEVVVALKERSTALKGISFDDILNAEYDKYIKPTGFLVPNEYIDPFLAHMRKLYDAKTAEVSQDLGYTSNDEIAVLKKFIYFTNWVGQERRESRNDDDATALVPRRYIDNFLDVASEVFEHHTDKIIKKEGYKPSTMKKNLIYEKLKYFTTWIIRKPQRRRK